MLQILTNFAAQFLKYKPLETGIQYGKVRFTMSFILYAQSDTWFCEFWVHLLDLNNLSNSVNVLVRAGRAFSAAAVLPRYGTHCVLLPQQLDHS